MMAYVTRYIYGTDKLRSNAFEVRAMNGTSSGIIHCDDLAILSQWLKIITDNIFGLTHLQVSGGTFLFLSSVLLPHDVSCFYCDRRLVRNLFAFWFQYLCLCLFDVIF